MRRPTVAATKLSSRSSVCRVRGLMPAVAAPSFAFRECRLACGFNVIKHSRVIHGINSNALAASAENEFTLPLIHGGDYVSHGFLLIWLNLQTKYPPESKGSQVYSVTCRRTVGSHVYNSL